MIFSLPRASFITRPRPPAPEQKLVRRNTSHGLCRCKHLFFCRATADIAICQHCFVHVLCFTAYQCPSRGFPYHINCIPGSSDKFDLKHTAVRYVTFTCLIVVSHGALTHTTLACQSKVLVAEKNRIQGSAYRVDELAQAAGPQTNQERPPLVLRVSGPTPC